MGTIAVVTGATRNLGLALAHGLSARLGKGDVVYLTSRDPARVASAVQTSPRAGAEVLGRTLDVADGAAVAQLASELADEHGGVDIVLSNHYARVEPDDDPAEVIDEYVRVNNFGTTQVLRAFAPLLRDGGRLFVVASRAGTLRALAPALHDRFDGLDSLDGVDCAIDTWRESVRARRAAGQAWPEWINIPSKIGQVAAVRALARERRADDIRRRILIAAVCPGLIDTGASRPWLDMTGARTPDEAARPLVDLALDPSPDFALYGELSLAGRVLPWKP
jgi:NAD(P)-dependent dehydrogenase (short-subunit alcohol dehydrogenase family)